MFVNSSRSRRSSSRIKSEKEGVNTDKTTSVEEDALDDEKGEKVVVEDQEKRKPLEGVVACLTGMPADLKDEYHDTIEALGGTFTRDFHTGRNTHLIAETPTGGKYDAAMACQTKQRKKQKPNQRHLMHVVQLSWLKACQEQQCCVDEKDHAWTHVNSSTKENGVSRKRKSLQNDAHDFSNSNKNIKEQQQQLVMALDQALLPRKDESNSGSPESVVVVGFPVPLFSSCQFYLVGFDTEEADIERTKLCRLLRRGMGTIFWDFHEGITHVIVYDQCDDAVRASVSKAKVESFHDHVAVVAPFWAVKSWQEKQMQSPLEHPAALEVNRKASLSGTHKASDNNQHKNDIIRATSCSTVAHKNTDKSSNLLRGYLFVLLRITNPPAWMVDYETKDLERLIRVNGGQILSLRLVEALKSDVLRQQQQQQQFSKRATKGDDKDILKRKCHVVCWGGNGTNTKLQQQQFALHPLLSQIQRKAICDVVTVTPNWLQTSVEEQSIADRTSLPLLFQPQAWPWRRLTMASNIKDEIKNDDDGGGDLTKSKQQTTKKASTKKVDSATAATNDVRISVTGFVGYQRQAMVKAIEATGAIFDNSMHQQNTTHLICADESISSQQHNQKVQKAREWKIHVVTTDWFYHVLQHGNEEGSEAKFTVVPDS